MSYINLHLQEVLRTHKQNLAVLDQQAEEARRPANYVAEVPFPIEGIDEDETLEDYQNRLADIGDRLVDIEQEQR